MEIPITTKFIGISALQNCNSIGVQFTSLHHIDHSTGVITPIDIDSKSPDLHDYIERLILDIRENNSKRSFEFKRSTTEVRAAIDLMLKGEYFNATNINVKRLLDVEIIAQQNMNKLSVQIQKGSLFQTLINLPDGQRIVIIGKADHNDYLDASDFVVHKGLPWKKRIFKSFLAVIDQTGDIKNVYISETTSVLTRYWWDDFLELSEMRSNKTNTKMFLKRLDEKVFNPIKNKYPADHNTLRNSTIGYFRSNTYFDLDDFYRTVFGSYSPIDEKLDIVDIQNKAKGIPQKYDLDGQFDIDKEEINIRAVRKYELNTGIELVLKESADIDNIYAFHDDEGEKYIAIKSIDGYNRFKKKDGAV